MKLKLISALLVIMVWPGVEAVVTITPSDDRKAALGLPVSVSDVAAVHVGVQVRTEVLLIGCTYSSDLFTALQNTKNYLKSAMTADLSVDESDSLQAFLFYFGLSDTCSLVTTKTSWSVVALIGQLNGAGYFESLNTKCVQYTDENAAVQNGTPREFLQALVRSLSS